MPETMFGVNLLDAIGIVGVALYLGSYAALQTGFLRGQGYAYAGINAAAATCVLISLSHNFNLSSALIQIFWIVISAVGIVRLYLLRRRLRFTPEESDLLNTILPDMPKERARELLNIGHWTTCDTGIALTRENEPVSHLFYLAEGEANVEVGGQVVASVQTNCFVGEITCLNGSAATGTVATTKPSLLFTIEAERLREFVAKNPDIRDQLEISFSKDLRHKLVTLTKSVSKSALLAPAGRT